MSKILKSALEDLLNVEKAIEIVNKEDSADPEDMILVSTYQDELEEIKEEQEQEQESGDETEQTSEDSPESEQEPTDGANENIEKSSGETKSDDSEEDKEPEEDKTEDKSDEEQSKADEKVVETAKEAEEAMEHLAVAVEFYKELQAIEKTKDFTKISTESARQKFVNFLDKYEDHELSLESFDLFDKGYSEKVIGLESFFNKVKSFVKKVVGKIVDFIKAIIAWFKEYFFKTESTRQAEVAKAQDLLKHIAYVKEKSGAINRDLQKKVNEVTKRTYKGGYVAIFATGNEASLKTDAFYKNLVSTFNQLDSYWSSVSMFFGKEFSKTLGALELFLKSDGKQVMPSPMANVSYASYRPVVLEKVNNYRQLGINKLAEKFAVYQSKALLSGNFRFFFVMPEAPLSDPIKESETGSAFSGFFAKEPKYESSSRLEVYYGDIDFAERVQKLSLDSNASYQVAVRFVNDTVRSLNIVSEKLLRAANAFKSTDVAGFEAVTKTARYNLAILNNLLDRPTIESIRYYDKLTSGVMNYAAYNLKEYLDLINAADDEKKELMP